MTLEDKIKELDMFLAQGIDCRHYYSSSTGKHVHTFDLAKDLKRALLALEFYANEKDDNWFAASLEGDSCSSDLVNPMGTKAREALSEILKD